jgi:hypothetical protein
VTGGSLEFQHDDSVTAHEICFIANQIRLLVINISSEITVFASHAVASGPPPALRRLPGGDET